MNRQFSEAQLKAIRHHTGPCLVLAGPGSGKTTVTTNRTKDLIETYGVNPSNILVITFTKAAAKEMEERFIKLMSGARLPVSFGTFHAVFFKILKYAYNYRAENILREEEKYQWLRELVEKEQLEIDDVKEFVASLVSEISSVKGDMIDITNYYSANCSDTVFRRIYQCYDERLRRANKVDFDDMLVMCYELLKARPDILTLWQKKYQFILIDEFQDINRVQYEIMKLLALPENNLFIVGDDDQSIYRFRGARPEIMLNFEREYPDAERIILDENYRSTANIVKASLRLIKNNQKRFEKQVHSVQEAGESVEYQKFANQQQENQYVVEKIKVYIQQGYHYSDMAVLVRTNLGPRFLVEKLMEFNIPFYMKDIMPNIYEHFIAKDLIAYMKLAIGTGMRADFLQIINHPKRYVSREALVKEDTGLQELIAYYADKAWMVERLEKLAYDLHLLKDMTPYAAITYIRQGIGYDAYLKEYAEFRRMNVEELYELIQDLSESAKPYRTIEEWFQHIQEYSEELLRQSREQQRGQDAVELITMHSAKGLEYEVVFLIDAVEGVTPHSKAILEEDLEEERRLFYVAVTRAKRHLHVYSVDERFNKPVLVSRFVAELQMDYDEVVIGVEVMHKKYGKGVVRRIDEGKITVYLYRLKKELVFDMKFSFSNGIMKVV